MAIGGSSGFGSGTGPSNQGGQSVAGAKSTSTTTTTMADDTRFMPTIGGTACHTIESFLGTEPVTPAPNPRATPEQWAIALQVARAKRAMAKVGRGIASVPGRIGHAIHESITHADARAKSVPKVQISGPMTTTETRAALQANIAGRGSQPLSDADMAEDLGKAGVGVSLNVNVTSKLYNRFVGDSKAIKGFFKNKAGQIPQSGYAAGIFPKEKALDEGQETEEAQLPIRAVASSVVNKLLGTHVIAESAFAEKVDEHGNVVKGYVSAAAPGQKLYVSHKAPGMTETSDTWNDIDYRNPAVQRGFADLQVNDWITGQVDRHGGNIFIDNSTGQVTGIDNDLAFGTQVAKWYGDRFGYPIEFNRGMPRMIDADTAKTILALKPDTLRAELQQLEQDGEHLPDDHIEAAVARLQLLQTSLQRRDPRIQVVKVWNDATFHAATGDVRADNNTLKQLGDTFDTKEFSDGTGILLRSIWAWQVANRFERSTRESKAAIKHIFADRGIALPPEFHRDLNRFDSPLPGYDSLVQKAQVVTDPMDIFK